MRRIAAQPRANWQNKVETAGLTWHTPGQTYWNESAFYEFTAREVEILEAATNELERMSLAAAQYIIDNRLYAQMGIPAHAVPLIENSWAAEPPSLYGRFDLAYCGSGPPKLLEYNADTPTSLLEAAVTQWYWLEETHSGSGQFNSIHDRLIALWKELAPSFPGGRIDFCSMSDPEDEMTIAYLIDTAQQAGLAASMFLIDDMGWDGAGSLRRTAGR
jgi:glutathionylspermidine synthase